MKVKCRMKLFATLTIAIIAGATIVASLGGGPRLFGFIQRIPGKDVTAHFLLYAALGLTVSTCLRRSARPAIHAHWGWIVFGMAVLVIGEEFSQAFISTRSFSVADLLASLGGLTAGALTSRCFARPRVAPETA